MRVTINYSSSSSITSNEITNVRSIRFAYEEQTSNRYKMTVTMTNSRGQSISLSYTANRVTNKIIQGLSYSREGHISLIIGIDNPVIWDEDISINEVWTTYFRVSFYQNRSDANRVDKTSYLTNIANFDGILRDDCSIVSPSILIAQDALPSFNYAYIAAFNRYYYVTNITSVRNGLWRIDMKCDVLMTYKTGIKALTAVIARQENDYNEELIDTEIPTEKKGDISFQEIGNTVLDTQGSGHRFVLTVIGA